MKISYQEINSLISEFSSNEQKARLENAHARRHWDSVKVLELDLFDHLVIHFHSDFENVPLLRLNKEKEHRLGAKRCK